MRLKDKEFATVMAGTARIAAEQESSSGIRHAM